MSITLLTSKQLTIENSVDKIQVIRQSLKLKGEYNNLVTLVTTSKYSGESIVTQVSNSDIDVLIAFISGRMINNN